MKFLTNKALEGLGDGTLNLASNTIKVMLLCGEKAGGATTSGSAVVTMTSTTGLAAKMRVTHANIPAGTEILTVDSGTQVTLTANATATGTGLTLTFGAGPSMNAVSEASGIEATGTGYTAGFGGSGRKTLASKTSTEDDTNKRAKLDAADLQWASINLGATKVTGFAFLKEITNDAGSLLIGYCDEGGFPITTNGGNLDLAWDSVGYAVLNNSGA